MSDQWTDPDEGITINPDDSEQVIGLLKEANPMDQPQLTVIGILNKGTDKENKLVRADWNGTTTALSPRTLSALEKIGINVVDIPENYVF